MNAHRLVIVAAALTVTVAAALATALTTFSSQALPRAVRHDLSHAAGTSMVIGGSVNNSQGAQYTSLLPGKISTALDGTPFAFYHAYWSDPLGFVPGARPVPPGGSQDVQIAVAAAIGDITAHAALVSGHWPGALPAPGSGGPIPAALPATAAALLHVTTGDVLRMRDRVSGRPLRFVVSGLYRPRQVSSPYWGLDDVALGGQSTLSGFTTYGPLTVPAAAFNGALTVAGGSWLAVPQTASVPASQLRDVAANVTGLRQDLADATQLPDLTMVTGLPVVLNGTASNRDVARSLLAICAVLLALLAGAALLAVARLLTGQREGESAMLVARGASRWQLIRLAIAEAIPLSVACAAAGGLAGVGLADLLAGPVAAGWPAIAAAVVVGVGAFVILLVPVLGIVTPGTARARRGRQAAVAGVTRAGVDVALVVLAVVAGYQLRHYSAVSAGSSGNYGVDPVIVAAPALALAGGTVLALRLLPAGGKAGDLLAARGRRLTAAMASWQISRQPIRQGGAALLIVLAVATGTLALSQRQSWTQSVHDQAAFSAGADVRIDASTPLTVAQAGTLAGSPGVRRAMPVASFVRTDTNEVTLALDAGQAARVVRMRPDQSPLAAGALFAKIRPSGPAPGITLPGRGTAFRLTARLGPAALHLGSALATVSVEDASNAVYQFNAGSLPADGQDHVLTVSLGSGPGFAAIYPLRLSAVNLQYTLPATKPAVPAVLTVDGVSGPSGQVAGRALRSWTAVASSAELQGVRQVIGTVGASALPSFSADSTVPAGGSAGGADSALAVTFQPGYGLAASNYVGVPPSSVGGQLTLTPAAPGVIPGVATQRFLSASNAHVGATVQTNLDGAVVPVKIVAAISTFPTVTGSGGGLMVDLGTLQAVLAQGQVEPAPVTQWWLAARDPARLSQPRLALPRAALPPGSAVVSASGIAAALLADPLSTVPQQALLAVAVAAAVLAITGFCVSIAAGVRQRRAENALLAALGVPPRAAAAQLCLEKLMLSVPSAVAGLVLGVVLAELLVPAITLTAAATTPVPPVLIQLGWSQTLALALAVAVLPVLAAALTIARRPDAAAELRAAESA